MASERVVEVKSQKTNNRQDLQSRQNLRNESIVDQNKFIAGQLDVIEHIENIFEDIRNILDAAELYKMQYLFIDALILLFLRNFKTFQKLLKIMKIRKNYIIFTFCRVFLIYTVRSGVVLVITAICKKERADLTAS